MVRCADKATSDKVKSSGLSTMIFFDGDGKEYHRTPVSTPDSVEAAFNKALEKYSKKPVAWASGEASDVISQSAGDPKKLVALVFADDRKDSEALLNALEDRWVAKHHERITFSKIAYERNSDIAKKWNVTTAPTILLVNPSEEDPRKRIVDQLVAKKELVSVRNFLVKGIEKFDKGTKK
jgi:hypothetical protein